MKLQMKKKREFERTSSENNNDKVFTPMKL